MKTDTQDSGVEENIGYKKCYVFQTKDCCTYLPVTNTWRCGLSNGYGLGNGYGSGYGTGTGHKTYPVILKLQLSGKRLEFPEQGNKCRAESVTVLEIVASPEVSDGFSQAWCPTEPVTVCYGFYNGQVYRPGDTITVTNFDDSSNKQCSNGIHYFKTLKEAQNYIF